MLIWFTELLQNMLSFRLSVGNLLFYRSQNNTDRNKNIFLLILNEPPRDKNNNVAVRSEDSDQPGHPPRLIRVFAVRTMGS